MFFISAEVDIRTSVHQRLKQVQAPPFSALISWGTSYGADREDHLLARAGQVSSFSSSSLLPRNMQRTGLHLPRPGGGLQNVVHRPHFSEIRANTKELRGIAF